MKYALNICVMASIGLVSVSTANEFTMFTDAEVSGQLRTAAVTQNNSTDTFTYASAVGAQLKYELAEYYGFNAGFGFITSQDIGLLTGDKDTGKQNDELSSSAGKHTELNEAYVNYNYGGLNFRSGKQVLDTPLADSDDIRMILNTFDAHTLTYEISSTTLMLGNLNKWQGFDAGLGDGWVKTGEDGTWFGGITYSGVVDFNIWYYNVTQALSAIYADFSAGYDINDDMSVNIAVQYLDESEIDNSGTAASIYGTSVELSAYGVGLGVAYNISNKIADKTSFSGFGGGTLFTNMDTMIIDEITLDRTATALVAALNYEIENFNIFYAYGDFIGEKDGAGETAHILEQNIGVEYAVGEELAMSVLYVIESDENSAAKTENDWSRFQGTISYNF